MVNVLECDPTICSVTRRTFAGIEISIFNLSKLPPASSTNPKDVAVLYILHGLGNSHKFSESVAYNVQEIHKHYRTNKTMPLISISFDMRNHGDRLVDEKRNEYWSQGNETHAIDMCSFIDGSVQDLKLIMDYLPALYPGYQFHNIISGTSMGGHTCYRFAVAYPKYIEAIIPIIACPELSSLLINRVKQVPIEETNCGLMKLAYEDLQLTEEQKKLWPEPFHNYISKQDFEIAENFPKHIRVFSLFGEIDTIVPPKYSEPWISENESSRCFDGSIEKYIYKGVGHDSTKGMCEAYSKWLIAHLSGY